MLFFDPVMAQHPLVLVAGYVGKTFHIELGKGEEQEPREGEEGELEEEAFHIRTGHR